jgi:hypothetical protein
MRFKATTWILVAALAALAAYFFLIEERSRAGKERARREGNKLFLYETKDVAGFAFTNPQGERIDVEREGEEWRIVHPVAAPGDAPTINAFIGQIVPGRRGRELASARDPADYGLAEPFATLVIRRRGVERPDTLFVGDKTPTSSNSYVRIGAAGPVIVSSEITHNVMNKNLFHLRDKRFLSMSAESIDGLEIERGAGAMKLRREGKHWWFDGRRARADRLKIEPYLGSLAQAIIYGFAREDADTIGPFGLDSRAKRLSFSRGGETIRVSFGSMSGDKVHALRDGLDKVVLLDGKLLGAFDWTAADLRAMNLSFLEEDSVRVFRYATYDTSVAFQRAGTKWITAEADSTGIRSWEVNALLRKLASTTYDRIVSEPLRADDPSLSPAHIVVTLENAAGAAFERIVIVAPDGGAERGASTTSACIGALPPGTADAIHAAFMRIGGRT